MSAGSPHIRPPAVYFSVITLYNFSRGWSTAGVTAVLVVMEADVSSNEGGGGLPGETRHRPEL
jgi:hypothetical protein